MCLLAVDYSVQGESPRGRPICEGDAHLDRRTRALDLTMQSDVVCLIVYIVDF
jgi:hypothetical protein